MCLMQTCICASYSGSIIFVMMSLLSVLSQNGGQIYAKLWPKCEHFDQTVFEKDLMKIETYFILLV